MNAKLLAVAVAAATLTACGGGGDNSATTGAATTTTPTTPTTKISGTAATGAALAGATVQAKCATGSGTATTAADGTFTIGIPNAVRPCVLSVQVPNGPVMHSVVDAGSGTTAVANITPLTELVTAAIAGGNTADFFNTFDAAAHGKLTSDGVTGAVSSVALSLSGVVDLGGANPLSDTLVAANGSTAGNAMDKAIDKLGAALTASGTTLEGLSTAVAANPGGNSTGPIQTILRPSAASCASFRSGKYFSVNTAENMIEVVTVDAAKLTVTYQSDSAVDTLTADSSQACRFVNADSQYGYDMVVGKGGIALLRNASGSASAFLVPAQKVGIDKKAGEWVGLTYTTTPDSAGKLKPSRVNMTIGADGKVTAGSRCYAGKPCGIWTPADFPVFTENADGIASTLSSGGTGYAVTFVGTDGHVSMFTTRPGGFTVASKAYTMTLPTVGTTNAYWDSRIDPDGAVSAFTPNSVKIDSVDTTANSYTRTRIEDGRVDTWTINDPVVGLRHRAAATNVNESIGLRIPAAGLSATISANVAQNFYSLSVDRP
ncbi:hypothetical protein P3W85_11330 [Cupriavidus basilensis]|uniref:Lipoprotein n=1 Tax=Cupriavidus basilensis TaxID=68895 RepID=A0ABT6ALP7_9BURK|nr:hypothetical protein [Cupriavidus basilensis]MDF3833535.1 hypothetical protein [Cupriavidus basilensis]